jgi:hypothetical protein
VDGIIEVESVIAELLAKLKTLGDRERGGELRFLALLFAIYLRPLGLVPGSEQGPYTSSHGPNLTLLFEEA